MPATIILRDKTYEVRHGSTLRMVLKKLEIEPETVLATRDGEMITEDEILRPDDVIKLIAVISGG
jgi:sulfur carrier protein ThiS